MPEFLESVMAIGPFCKLPEPYGSDGRCGTEKIRRTKEIMDGRVLQAAKKPAAPGFFNYFS